MSIPTAFQAATSVRRSKSRPRQESSSKLLLRLAVDIEIAKDFAVATNVDLARAVSKGIIPDSFRPQQEELLREVLSLMKKLRLQLEPHTSLADYRHRFSIERECQRETNPPRLSTIRRSVKGLAVANLCTTPTNVGRSASNSRFGRVHDKYPSGQSWRFSTMALDIHSTLPIFIWNTNSCIDMAPATRSLH